MQNCFVLALIMVVVVVIFGIVTSAWGQQFFSLHAARGNEPSPSSYLGFTHNNQKIAITGVDLATTLLPYLSHSSIGGLDELWTLAGIKFKAGATETDTGVYAFYENMTEPACKTACVNAPLCRLYEVDATNTTCKLSTTNFRNIQTLYADNLLAKDSPFEKSASSNVHVLLRRPIIVTNLHDSACDCNTICALQEVRHANWPFNEGSGQCVGTLNNKGQYVNTCTGFTTHPQRLTKYQEQLAANKVVGLPSTVYPMFAANTANKTQLQQFQEAGHQKFCVCMWDPSGVPRERLPPNMLDIMNLSCPYRIPDVTTLLTDLANVDL